MEQMVNEALELLSKSTKKIGSSTVEKAKPYFQLSDELLKVCDCNKTVPTMLWVNDYA